MFVQFEEMLKDSRVWVYQSGRPLEKEEQELIIKKLTVFLTEWASHGNDLKCSAKIMYAQFLLISVDEGFNKASGCSIDTSVHFIKELGEMFGIDWFDRTKIAFMENDKVFTESHKDLKKQITEGKIDEKTLTFNNLVTNIGELDKKWILPAGDTWLNRYF